MTPDDDAPLSPLSQLLVCAIALMQSAFEVDSDANESIMVDIVSSTGSRERRPYKLKTREEKFLSTSLGVTSAYLSLRASSGWRTKIVAMRHGKLSERLRMAVFVSWDRIYVLRERFRRWVEVVNAADGLASKQLAQIKSLMVTYKKKSDSLLSRRAQHVHNSEAHHPHINQLSTLESLTTPIGSDAEFLDAMKSLRRVSASRAKKLVAEEADRNETLIVELTENCFSQVLRCAGDRLSFKPFFEIAIKEAEGTQHISPI